MTPSDYPPYEPFFDEGVCENCGLSPTETWGCDCWEEDGPVWIEDEDPLDKASHQG